MLGMLTVETGEKGGLCIVYVKYALSLNNEHHITFISYPNVPCFGSLDGLGGLGFRNNTSVS